jgi:hypothetical protein
MVLGHENMGIVEETGPGVNRVASTATAGPVCLHAVAEEPIWHQTPPAGKAKARGLSTTLAGS